MIRTRARHTLTTLLLLGAGTLGVAQAAQPAPMPVASAPETVSQWATDVWSRAVEGDTDGAIELLEGLPSDARGLGLADLADSIDRYRKNLGDREAARAERLAELRESMSSPGEDGEPKETLELLRDAVEISALTTKGKGTVEDPALRELASRAELEAVQFEKDGEWLKAHALFDRLNLLYDGDGRYKADLERLSQRLIMLSLYAPDILHDMRNQIRVEQGEDALHEFNAIGDSWREKLQGINRDMVFQPLIYAAKFHYDEVEVEKILLGGLRAMRTLISTDDLVREFPSMANKQEVDRFLGGIEESIAWVQERLDERAEKGIKTRQDYELIRMVTSVVDTTVKQNEQTLNLPIEVILHEFGNGALGQLDDYTAMIWPDELAGFRRSTDGQFVGVGIQITLNDLKELTVVAPISSTPAWKAGVRPGDIIRQVDGEPTTGISLNQAVDRITGPLGSEVVLGIEREGEATLLQMTMNRAPIPIYATKGWARTGAGEMDWDWMIDADNGIGYIRLTQFNNRATTEIREAMRTMEKQGLRGLILDMRYNPGGLLTEAVGVSNLFLTEGMIVGQEDNQGNLLPNTVERARRSGTVAADLPLVVLINEGSASASEIVAGALQDYDRAVVVGERSFGKGSVQNVYPLRGGNAQFKLTTHHYKLPGGRAMHRSTNLPREQWGLKPDVVVEMLPSQIGDALKMRQSADVYPFDPETGEAIAGVEAVEPERLLSEGVDPQLETALLLLQSRLTVERTLAARKDLKDAG